MTTLIKLEAAATAQQETDLGWNAPSERFLLVASGGSGKKSRAKKDALVRTGLRNLKVTLEATPDGKWVADEPLTGQFGTGADPGQAINDLYATLDQYVAVMTKRAGALSPYLREQLNWLQR